MIQIIQHKSSDAGGKEQYPWPRAAANAASAKGQIKTWLGKVAQHWLLEQAPSFTWSGNKSDDLTFGAGTEEWVVYSFELREIGAPVSGRISSSSPNIQNIPIRTPEGAKIKDAMRKLFSGDGSTISGHPLLSEEDMAFHRATGEQIPKERS